jgi:hypothetical protein
VLDDEVLMQQLHTMPRQAAYQHLFIRLNLKPNEVEEILKECFPSQSIGEEGRRGKTLTNERY